MAVTQAAASTAATADTVLASTFPKNCIKDPGIGLWSTNGDRLIFFGGDRLIWYLEHGANFDRSITP